MEKKLHEIVRERNDKEIALARYIKESNSVIEAYKSQIEKLKKLESVGGNGLDVEKIQLANKIIFCIGSVDKYVDGSVLADVAIIDIANGCDRLKTQYFGNKRYESFYQRSDHKYGYGPSHGSSVDEIGLRNYYRNKDLTDEQKDACIYYLKNYSIIKNPELAK